MITEKQRKALALGPQARRGRLPVPVHVSRLTRQFYELVNAEQATLTEIAGRSGLSEHTLSDWRRRWAPKVDSFEAALNALGYELRIVKRYEAR